ncbi:sugar phosphate isomerase/epimerase family protein [Streptomyces sp. NPDC000594]|uniref:sugar phosphate isomerase/epimerase family protein n=1 Tax=Streptomyces sp. NPDC000594 TaxID=3154261 RepID=UPI0033321E19
MRYAFSTLGVPDLPPAEVAALAADSGYQGVELRCAPDEPVHPGLTQHDRHKVAEEFARAGVEILSVCGYTRVAAADDDTRVLHEIGELIWLARDLGASYVRVFPGADPEAGEAEIPGPRPVGSAGPMETGPLEAALPEEGSPDDGPVADEPRPFPRGADALAARRLGRAAGTAASAGVRLLLETHDSHRTGVDVSRVLGPVGHRGAGALWDVLHPWLGGEDPAVTHAALAPFLGYVQVKDVAGPDDLTPLRLGAGAVPLAACLAPLAPGTWISWEYEKRWYPGAAELPELLVPGRIHLETLIAAVGAGGPV